MPDDKYFVSQSQIKNIRDIYWEEIHKPFESNLIGKIAIVTGGTKGIGKAVVERFIKAGATVIVVSRSDPGELSNTNANCHYIPADVRNSSRVQEVVAEVVSKFGSVDILINCAGYAFLTDIKDETEELFDKIMDINFKGTRNFIVASALHLEKSHGCIVSIGSIWGLPGTNLAGDATYSAGDAAIIKYSEVAAEELPAIRINTISPALVNTAMNNDMTLEARGEFAKHYKNRDTLIEPDEIAEVVEYVVNSEFTQKNVIVDFGYTERVGSLLT